MTKRTNASQLRELDAAELKGVNGGAAGQPTNSTIPIYKPVYVPTLPGTKL